MQRVTEVKAATDATATAAASLSSDKQSGLTAAITRLLERSESIAVATETDPASVQVLARDETLKRGRGDAKTLETLTPGASKASITVGTGQPRLSAYYQAGQPSLEPIPQRINLATRPADGEEQNGDGAVLVRTPNQVFSSVLDGLGHGPAAAKATEGALAYCRDHPDSSIKAIFDGIDRACSETRGVVAAILKIDYATETGAFGSVGNIDWRSEGVPFSLLPRRGVLGSQAPAPAVTNGDWSTESKLVMYSDGISGVHIADIETQQAPAATLVERNGGHDDDATALTIFPPSS